MQFLDRDNLKEIKDFNGGYIAKAKSGVQDPPYIHTDCLVMEASGVNNFLGYIKENMPDARQSGSSDERDGNFYHFDSFNEAMDIYLDNPSKVRSFDEKNEMLTGGDEAGLGVEFDTEGDWIDIGRFIEGVPEHVGSLTMGNPRGFRVNIIVNMSLVWTLDQGTINRRSSRIVRLVDWLESQGIRTQITMVNSDECCHIELSVKEFDEPLDLNDIAVVSHSDFLRRVIFRVDEHSDTWSYGYGSSTCFSQFVAGYNPDMPLNEITILMDSQLNNVDRVDEEFDGLEESIPAIISGLSDEKRYICILSDYQETYTVTAPITLATAPITLAELPF